MFCDCSFSRSHLFNFDRNGAKPFSHLPQRPEIFGTGLLFRLRNSLGSGLLVRLYNLDSGLLVGFYNLNSGLLIGFYYLDSGLLVRLYHFDSGLLVRLYDLNSGLLFRFFNLDSGLLVGFFNLDPGLFSSGLLSSRLLVGLGDPLSV